MPTFDPTKPATNAPIVSAELRNQLNALNDTLTSTTTMALASQTTLIPVATTVNAWKQNLSGMTGISTTYTDPVSASDLSELRDKLNDLISALTT